MTRKEHAPRKHISTDEFTGCQDSGRGSARMNIFSNFFVTKSLLSPTDASQDPVLPVAGPSTGTGAKLTGTKVLIRSTTSTTAAWGGYYLPLVGPLLVTAIVVLVLTNSLASAVLVPDAG